ncbi:prephenate dehydratase [Methanococcoides seepicolus]|uniref:prephenate dehydratase n=1 Tax=Methanococcoides seepicolus TaxID=2828780 RepID=A0A9E5DBB0_9EURY|nr:prephenate dehydratase [Methanococcoides seepicolus]MCM1985914.1 prephenate dehydratase [Methanococcoides seepicolus]
MIIGVLGPAGSYSEKAAKGWISKESKTEGTSLVYYDDINDTFASVINGDSDIGIIPIENSIEGSVGITLDLLLESDMTIIGEIVVPIKHCLLSKGEMKDIKIIMSHPQALAQCSKFIRKHFKKAEIRTTGSTSHAAKLANEFCEMAAIASKESAREYGLKVLVPNIQDWEKNHTRFIVIKQGKWQEDEACIPKNDTCKTSIIADIDEDRPGSLYEIIGEFAKRDINLTRIESRPSKRSLGDYLFYIDIEGSTGDAVIKDALYYINSKVSMLKVLGSYNGYKLDN